MGGREIAFSRRSHYHRDPSMNTAGRSCPMDARAAGSSLV
jgi:hypothetical protein